MALQKIIKTTRNNQGSTVIETAIVSTLVMSMSYLLFGIILFCFSKYYLEHLLYQSLVCQAEGQKNCKEQLIKKIPPWVNVQKLDLWSPLHGPELLHYQRGFMKSVFKLSDLSWMQIVLKSEQQLLIEPGIEK